MKLIIFRILLSCDFKCFSVCLCSVICWLVSVSMWWGSAIIRSSPSPCVTVTSHQVQVQVLLTITWSQVRQVKVRVAVSPSTLAPTSPPTGTAPAYLSSTDTSPSPWAEEGVNKQFL